MRGGRRRRRRNRRGGKETCEEADWSRGQERRSGEEVVEEAGEEKGETAGCWRGKVCDIGGWGGVGMSEKCEGGKREYGIGSWKKGGSRLGGSERDVDVEIEEAWSMIGVADLDWWTH